MPNVAAVLKAEIARVARQQLKAELTPLKKSLQGQRAIAKKQRERIEALQKEVAALRKLAGAPRRGRAAPPDEAAAAADAPKRRFSPARLKTQRQRLGLSAAEFGRLVGVSGQAVYGWERGLSRPAAASLERIAAMRALTKRQAAERLAALGEPA